MGAIESILATQSGWHGHRTHGVTLDYVLLREASLDCLLWAVSAPVPCSQHRGTGQHGDGALGLFKRVQSWGGEPGPPESRRVSSWQSSPSHVEQPQLLVPLGCETEGPAA